MGLLRRNHRERERGGGGGERVALARVYPAGLVNIISSVVYGAVRAGAHLESRDSPNEFPAPGKLDRKSLATRGNLANAL